MVRINISLYLYIIVLNFPSYNDIELCLNFNTKANNKYIY